MRQPAICHPIFTLRWLNHTTLHVWSQLGFFHWCIHVPDTVCNVINNIISPSKFSLQNSRFHSCWVQRVMQKQTAYFQFSGHSMSCDSSRASWVAHEIYSSVILEMDWMASFRLCVHVFLSLTLVHYSVMTVVDTCRVFPNHYCFIHWCILIRL